jgi:trigger factor
MQVSVETTSALERRMKVEVPEEQIEKAVEERLRNLARTTRIKGFRPGKVPMSVVKQRYGGQVRQEVVGEVVQSTFYEAVTQEKLRPVGLPEIEPTSTDEGKNLEYTATFEVFPEIELAGLEGISIDKPAAEVTDADVDRMLDTLRKQATSWEEVERAAEEGDRVTVDFRGTIDGEEFDGNSGENVPVTIGGKRMIAGFEEGLAGAKAGDEKTLDLEFPEDYAYTKVAGKPVQFTVTVKRVEKPQLPEVDDAFAERFGIKEGGVDALREEIRSNMERELSQALKNRVKQQVMGKLLEINNLDIPKGLIDNEAQALMRQTEQQMYTPDGKSGVKLDPSMFEEQAERRVSLGLLMSEVVKKHEIKADPAKVRETVEGLAATYEHPDEVVQWYYADRQRLGEVESLVLEDQVVDWVLGQVQVNEVPSSFEEIMNQTQAG